MERLRIISFALEQYNDTLSITKLDEEFSEIKIGPGLRLTLPNEFLAESYEDGTYLCSVANGKLTLIGAKSEKWRN